MMDTFHSEDVVLESYYEHKGNALKILLGIYRGNYYKFFLSAVFYLIKHSPAWVMPIVIANIVNAVTYENANPMHTIIINSVVIVALVILNVPMNYLHKHFSSSAVRDVEAGLRSALIRKLQQLSMTFHKDFASGRVQSKVIRDVEAVQTLSSQMLVSLMNIVINISVALIITVSTNMVVFLFFLLTIPVASLTIVAFREHIKKQNHLFRKKIEQASARVMDMEAMIPVTRAHALENVEVEQMSHLVQEVSKEGYRLDIIQANFGSVSWAIFQIFQVGCLVFTAAMAIKGTIMAGDIVLYQSYFTTIVAQVSSLIMLLPTIAKGMESVNSIGEVLCEEDIEDNTNKMVLDGLDGSYSFKHMDFAYPGHENTVLKDFNLDVKSGETVAFVGGSGAGKSTIMNLIIGFNMPTKGQLKIDGNAITDINLRSYRKNLAVVPQNTILFSGTIRDNISYGMPKVTEAQINHAVVAANLKELIDQLPEGLETKVGEHGNKLSGGQRQRIAIARAIIRNPRVIIFDEATSALDSVSESLILGAMENLTKDRTTFIVAHRLSTIQKADKICVLKEGQCLEYGSYDELMALKGEFYKMKSLQA